MSESLNIFFIIMGCLGMIASLMCAFFPCWVLINSQKKYPRIVWKFLGIAAFFGWAAFFGEISERFEFLGDRESETGVNSLVVLVGLSVMGALIYTAAERGERIARLEGRIEENRGQICYVTKER
jgi:hypothetical protein